MAGYFDKEIHVLSEEGDADIGLYSDAIIRALREAIGPDDEKPDDYHPEFA